MRLTHHWQVFNDLYFHSEKRIQLLNRTAPNFFRLAEDMLIDRMNRNLVQAGLLARLGSFQQESFSNLRDVEDCGSTNGYNPDRPSTRHD